MAVAALAVAALSGGSAADPQTPAAMPGRPPPFLGTAVVGSGGLTAAIDSYGDVVDLRAPGPAGRALIDNPVDRQAAGSVPAATGIVPRVRIGDGPALPLWRADAIAQRYLRGTNAVRTVARLGRVRVVITDAALGRRLARTIAVSAPPDLRASPALDVRVEAGVRCTEEAPGRRLTLVCSAGESRGARVPAQAIIAAAAAEDRRWIARAHPLAPGAPVWASRMQRRSLLTLRALTDRRTGAVAAGARDGWAYVWPRDAGTAALALAASGYRPQARRVARFLLGLDLDAAARFDDDGAPVGGREAQGDAAGWVAVAARAAGLPPPSRPLSWRERADYQEGRPGDYLANAIATAEPPADGPKSHAYGGKSAHRRGVSGIQAGFGTERGLVRRRGDPGSGLDSAAAWAVRPFPLPALFATARGTLLRLTGEQTRFGITPGEGWAGVDPWTAPTAWSAWSLAALADGERGGNAASGAARRNRDRRAALRLLGDLRRAATPAGALPERVDARTGIPRSTTPLAWSHAFAILALYELWPSRSGTDLRRAPGR